MRTFNFVESEYAEYIIYEKSIPIIYQLLSLQCIPLQNLRLLFFSILLT